MPSWLALGFQDSGSFSMSEIFCLHDYIMVILLLVILLVFYVMVLLVSSSIFYKYLVEGTLIETIWSIIPSFLLVVLVVPSMKALYSMEDVNSPYLTVKVVGHQWYWSYILSFLHNRVYSIGSSCLKFFMFDSIMNNDSVSYPRLLSCSQSLVIPVQATTRFIISSTDVIHAFSLPALGLKVDALPGRVSQLYVTPTRVGLYFGQCSEICGSNHSFMPIEVCVSQPVDFNYFCGSNFLDTISSFVDISTFKYSSYTLFIL
uniref:Cytochrome c oxidase subunit 2 n=1 Tax=Histiostoma blomquisti TaxID=1902798 RepID=A0A342Y120_9ACAR|nr:cytochrome c oxidase subunit II [Histiostoma blomquisti]AOR08472.1 cytochrome c oxidase subunit II [Histiostoma blomquisti]